MSVLAGKRWAGPVYWLVAVALALVAAILGGRWGSSQAPEFHGEDDNGAPATSASHLIYAIGGAVLCGLAVLAVAAAVFFVVWARERRRGGEEQWDEQAQDDDLDLDDVEGMFEPDDEAPPQRSHPGSGS